MAIDPRSMIREILSRRPDLRKAYAPRLRDMGFPLPNVPPARGLSYTGVMSGDELGPLAQYAGRTPSPPTGLSPDEMALPFGGTGGDPNSLRSMADRGDPSQAPDFRSLLNAASQTAGSARVAPGSGLAASGTNPTAQVQGQLPSDFLQSPQFGGNLPRTRPPEQLTPGGPPPPTAGAGPPSPLAGASPPAPIIGREAPPGLNGPPSPLASRFGDQSQLPGGAFSGSFPKPPQARPFESMIAGRPMPPGGPGSLPAASLLAGKPFPSAPGMSSRFGDQSQLASGAFSGGPPPPMAAGPTPQQLDAAKDMVRQMASLPSVPPPSSLQPIETTPTSTMPNPLQRAPLNLAAGIGATAQPLGSTSLPFAGIPPTPASVDQRTADVLGPLPPGAGTGAPVRSVQTPLIAAPPASGTVPPVGPVPSQDLPSPPPVGVPPSLASVGPPNPARMEVVANYNPQTGQRTAGTPRGKGARQAIAAAAPSPVVPAQEQQKPFWNAPNIGTAVGAGAGLLAGGGIGGAAVGAGGGRILGKVIQAIRNRGQTVDAQGNILNKAGEVVGHVSDMLGKAGSGLGGIFGSGGNSMGSGGMGMGGMGGYGYSGGGGMGGQYGGGGGYNIRESIGGAYRNR